MSQQHQYQSLPMWQTTIYQNFNQNTYNNQGSIPVQSDGVTLAGAVTVAGWNKPTVTLRLTDGSGCHVTSRKDFPLRVNDVIKGTFYHNPSDGNYYIGTKLPSVLIPCDEKNIVNTIMFLLKKQGFSYQSACGSYKTIMEMVRDMEMKDAAEYISMLAERWNSYHDPLILDRLLPDMRPNEFKIILTWWRQNYNLRRLQHLGLTRTEIRASNMDYVTLYTKCRNDPYSVPSISMEKADSIVDLCLITATPEQRRCGIILRNMYDNEQKRGWSCTPCSHLTRKHPDFESLRDMLKEKYGVIMDTISLNGEPKCEMAYFSTTFQSENLVAKYIIARLSPEETEEEELARLTLQTTITTRYERTLSEIAPGPSIRPSDPLPLSPDSRLDEHQMSALRTVLKGGVSIITGGPGTGKTSTIKEIVRQFDLKGIIYKLASYTGKAVSRIKDVVRSKTPPSTLHHMISAPDACGKFQVLIIDEASMVTTDLLSKVFSIFGTDYSLILVGDANQLPPIGWGSLFNQLLESRTIPCTVLQVNHRVMEAPGEVDGILANISKIPRWRDGIPFPFQQTDNCRFIDGDALIIMKMITAFKDQGINPNDIKIICPFNAYLDSINGACQRIWNGSQKNTVGGGKTWFVNDLVMCIENNYDNNVMNGEEGIIKDVNDRTIEVDFGSGRLVHVRLEGGPSRYNRKNDDDNDDEVERVGAMTVSDITLAYALTVHKSQGSEYLHTIFLMPGGTMGSRSFLTRNLVYTGLSRARRSLWHIGDKMKTATAVGQPLPYRYECLSDRLLQKLPVIHEKEKQIELTAYSVVPDEYRDDDDEFAYFD